MTDARRSAFLPLTVLATACWLLFSMVLPCRGAAVPQNTEQLTVKQLESRWRVLYKKGSDALEAHDPAAAKTFFRKGIDLLSANDALRSTYHVYSLIKLGEACFESGDDAGQEEVLKELSAIGETLRPGSKRHLEYLYNLGVYYSDTGRFEEAVASLEEALSYREALSQMPGGESRFLHRLALCRYCLGDLAGAIGTAETCVGMDDNRTPDYVKALAYYYFQASDWEKLEALMPRCYDDAREPVLRKFSQAKADERATFWSRAGLFFTDYLPGYAWRHPSDVLVSYAYDAALFGKGVLLAATNKSSDLIRQSGDPELVRLYGRYLELKGRRNRSLDEEFEMQSLSDVVVRCQAEHKSNYRKDFRIRWTDVQACLGADDLAVEFLTVPDGRGGSVYLALTLKKGWPAPKLTELADFDDLSDVPAEAVYTTPALYNLVWGPLAEQMEGVQNIYFSPAGMFYNTGIEYLPDGDDLNLNAVKNVFRLSSTKELVLARNKPLGKADLFGGIDYDTKISVLARQSPAYAENAGKERGVPLDSLDIRGAATTGGFGYLDGTMEEIGDISMILLENDIAADMFAGEEGSESAFKNLNGTDAGLLHVATHGFYYADRKSGKSPSLEKLFRDLGLHFASDEVEVIREDKMLTRSGLILSGANNVIRRIPIPEGVEDGVLYADEIAGIDLSGVGLLVLSACQSGLGDIAASEGVFGLQRGFKLAGVGSIVMSLWKVDDNATRLLMTEFYRNLMQGQSRQAALANAQLFLRSCEGGIYDEPRYWAAFVLLDAVN